MSETTSRALVRQGPMAVDRPDDSLASVMSIIERAAKDSSIDVDKMDRLLGMAERMEARRAEKEFNGAFVSLQTRMSKVKATRAVPNDDGTVRYTYAPLEAIMDQMRPEAEQLGFAMSFSEAPSVEGKITAVFILRHVGGHKESFPYTVRIGQGPPKTSDSQKDGSAHMYARRGAVCAALNVIVTGMDADARNEGGVVSKEQADDLRRRVRETASDEAAFLKFSGAKTFEEISTSKFCILDQALRRKERTV